MSSDGELNIDNLISRLLEGRIIVIFKGILLLNVSKIKKN